MEYLIGLLGAGIGSGVMGIITLCLQRHWAKKDSRDGRLDALVAANKLLMIDRVKHLAKRYIKAGKIPLEEKEHIHEMHAAYKALGGNGHLDTTMAEIDRLQVVDE